MRPVILADLAPPLPPTNRRNRVCAVLARLGAALADLWRRCTGRSHGGYHRAEVPITSAVDEPGASCPFSHGDSEPIELHRFDSAEAQLDALWAAYVEPGLVPPGAWVPGEGLADARAA